MLNNAINKAPDGIALAACDQSSVLKSLQNALDKKIPVVCFDTGVADAPEGSVYATVVTNNEEAGGIAAEKNVRSSERSACKRKRCCKNW